LSSGVALYLESQRSRLSRWQCFGTTFTWTDSAGNATKGNTACSVSAAEGKRFAPSNSTFMVNYRVEDLGALLTALRKEGCEVLEKTDDSDYGKFGWVMDPEGNKVELWQPPEGQ
jgi:predicted enzyme related to lactoylglutathione lyase